MTSSSESAPRADAPLSAYMWEVRKLIDKNKFYPLIAKRMNHQGTVEAVFVIDRSGKVVHIESVKGSYDTLAKATKELLSRQVFPSFPSEISSASLRVSVPVKFMLQ